MGLDMYLTGERYLWSTNDADKAKGEQINALFPELKGKQIKTIRVEAGYWRKANHIHKWFVDNVQDGKDECKEHYVNDDHLRQLLSTCKAVLASRHGPNAQANAEAMLPTASGFFFGGTAYDEYYYSDIEKTVEILESIVDNEELKDWDFHYCSSW